MANQQPSITLFEVGGVTYKYLFYAFVNIEKAEEAGLDLDKVTSPYDLWNSKLNPEDYAVLLKKDEDLARELAKNPDFKGLELLCNN